jgi:hypothetical protein
MDFQKLPTVTLPTAYFSISLFNNQTTTKKPFLNELIRIEFFKRADAVKVARMRTGKEPFAIFALNDYP